MGDGMRSQWRDFIEGEIYTDAQAPWRDDPAFVLLRQFPGLREGVGGRIAPALTQTIDLVRAVAGVDLTGLVQAKRPSLGLCLGFGMNLLEPYDLLTVFELDRVHAYEWIGEHVVEAAQALQALRVEDPFLPTRIRLHHSTISDLSALAEGSIRVIYVGNVFNSEIPMSTDTFAEAVKGMVRVLEVGGVLISRGSSGLLETALEPSGRMLLATPLVSVFEKSRCAIARLTGKQKNNISFCKKIRRANPRFLIALWAEEGAKCDRTVCTGSWREFGEGYENRSSLHWP